jgi:GNAT superfamily N-acetyltransferase
MSSFQLRRPSSEQEWTAYHDIRRTVLFERRGRFGVYDASHPDEHEPENHALLLFVAGEPVGTIRVDLGADTAIFRRVAVREDVQRRGYGRTMLQLAEEFVRQQGRHRIQSYVDRGAVEFYERCGFVRDLDAENDGATVLMYKN